MEEPIIDKIFIDKSQARLGLIGVTDKIGIMATIFEEFSDINIDMIVQTQSHDGYANIDLTFYKDDIDKVKSILDVLKSKDFIQNLEIETDICKVYIEGLGMKSHSNIASKMFSILAKNGINMLMITTSEIKISVVVNEKFGDLAVKKLNEEFMDK